MTTKRNLHESAAEGAVSANSIAVRHDNKSHPPSDIRRRGGLLNFLSSYQTKKLGNRLDMKPVETPFKVTVNENVSLDQIYSKLSGIENSSRKDDYNSVTYGVEDDNGNLMKITVRSDQSEDFEAALAQELAEVEEYKQTGRGGKGRDISMAEVLFNLKQKFDIINVEFPEIPTDRVYNADKVTKPEDMASEFQSPPADSPLGDDDASLPDETGEMPEEDSPDTETGDDDLDLDFDPDSDEDSDESGDEDSDISLDLDTSSDEPDEESILKQIVRMMSADAEAKKAQHEAEAEKYRAMQAEYAAKAAKQEMYQQEELLKMEEEQKRQKEKEAGAKKLADLARFRLRGGVSEGTSFLSILSELNDLEDETTIRMQMRNIRDIEDPREQAMQRQIVNNKRRILQRRKALKQQEDDRQQNQEQNDDIRDNQPQQRNAAISNQPPIGGSNVQ